MAVRAIWPWLAGIIFTAFAFALTPITALAGNIARGAEIASDNCGACHAVEAERESPLSDAPPFRDLSQRYPVAQLAEALAEGIVSGHPDMPEISLPSDDVDALIAYLESIQVR